MTMHNAEIVRTPSERPAELTAGDVITQIPLVDIYENNDEIIVLADFPGVANDELTVRLEGAELWIEGRQPRAEGEAHTKQVAFSRTFRVPSTIDPNAVTAELARGVLRVRLTKSEAAKPRRIQVRSD